MREAVAELVARTDLVLTDTIDLETIEWAEKLIGRFERPAQGDEAEALVKLLGRSDETSCHGLNWTILHFIETAPGWPLWPTLLEAEGEWPERLKTGLRNAGLMPPATADIEE